MLACLLKHYMTQALVEYKSCPERTFFFSSSEARFLCQNIIGHQMGCLTLTIELSSTASWARNLSVVQELNEGKAKILEKRKTVSMFCSEVELKSMSLILPKSREASPSLSIVVEFSCTLKDPIRVYCRLLLA